MAAVLCASGLLVAVITAALGVIAGPVRAEELDRELVLGDWIDDNGLQWSIAVEEPSGVIPTTAQPPAQKSSAAIEPKQKELDALKADTRHYWKNVDTGEILKQPRDQPRNPGLPYFYMGEAPNDAEKVKALTEEIAALQSASGGVPQPPAFRNPRNGLPATVSVKLADGRTVVFKEGWYDGDSIQARRRITDLADIPADVAIEKTRSEIASKWQPWQWLDFKVIRKPSNGETRLAGDFWSSPFVATEEGTVTRIDPAESATLNLVREMRGVSYGVSGGPGFGRDVVEP